MRRKFRLGAIQSLEDRTTPAGAGGLDPTFGSAGISTIPLASGYDQATARAAVTQPDGRVILAGSALSSLGETDFFVVRMLTNGFPDPTFGFGGIQVIPFDLGGALNDNCSSIALQSDGKVVVAGTVDTAANGTDFAIARLDTNGVLDTTFGTKGTFTFPFNSGGSSSFNDDGAGAVAVQTDGKIVVAGFARFDFAVARLTSAGALDTSFGNKGQASIVFPGTGFNVDKAQAMAIQSDGKIVVAGYVDGSSFQNDFGVARLTSAGVLDTSFGSKGTTTVAFDFAGSKNDRANAVAIQTDGKIVIAGTADAGSSFGSNRTDIAVARMNADGSLDNVFSSGGKMRIGIDGGGNNADEGTGVLAQPDGKIVITGNAERSGGGGGGFGGSNQYDFVAIRVDTDGVYDSTFGTNGITKIKFNNPGGFGSTPPGAYAATLQPSGNIVLAGTNSTNFVAVRLFGAEPPAIPLPPEPPSDGGSARPTPLPLSAFPLAPAPILAGGRNDGTARVLINRGGAFFPNSTVVSFPGQSTEVRTAIGDVNGDLVPDYIGGSGPGSLAQVTIIDGESGEQIAQFNPFENFTGGVYVVAGDINGDGRADVIVTPDQGGGPVVAVYSGSKLASGIRPDRAQVARFFGIDDKAFRGGARAAIGDLNGDGIAEVIVTAGFGGGPRVAVFNGKDVYTGNPAPGRLLPDFFAFESGLRNGAFVSAGDVDGDKVVDLAFGAGPGGAPRIRVINGAKFLNTGSFSSLDQISDTAQMLNFFAGDSSLRGGVRVNLRDIDGDSKADVSAGSGTNEPSRVRVYTASNLLKNTIKTSHDLNPFNSEILTNGAFVG